MTKSSIQKTIELIKIKNIFNSKTSFFHGNENKTHIFSEYQPCFFTTDKEYALCYGETVKEYNIDTKKPFDTATDNIALNYYNDVFLKDELGKDAKKISNGEHISFIHADNFFAFIAVEELIGKGFGYDSIIVHEGHFGDSFDTNLSIVPFDVRQIIPTNKPIKKNKLKKVKNI